MGNQWSQLVRMLELRKARQESSLQETNLQLDAARKAHLEQEAIVASEAVKDLGRKPGR